MKGAREENGKQSVSVGLDGSSPWDRGTWYFCQNGYQSTGVDVSVEQFEMMQSLCSNPEVIEFYSQMKGEQK